MILFLLVFIFSKVVTKDDALLYVDHCQFFLKPTGLLPDRQTDRQTKRDTIMELQQKLKEKNKLGWKSNLLGFVPTNEWMIKKPRNNTRNTRYASK